MKIIYWTGTGNTGAMATLIGKGINEVGEEAELINISSNKVNSLKDEECIVLGCPSMGAEELEDGEFEPFLEEIGAELRGKKVFLFGSYGWGNGEWMEAFEDRILDLGGILPLDSVTVNYVPEGESEELCIEYGRKIAKECR